MTSISCKGDMDSLGYTIEGGCSDTVKVNGKPIAVKDSTMSDGVGILFTPASTVRVNGVPVVVVGSITEPHNKPPFLPGLIITGDGTVNANG